VLGLAATRSTLVSGLVLLVAYSLGLGVPFMATGLAFGRLTRLLAPVRRRLWMVNLAAGVALVVFGVLLVTNNLHWVSEQVATALRALGLSRLTVS
jgi:cytochrome c-type biogenesis protein